MFSATGSRLRDAIGLCLVLFVLASCGGGGGGGGSSTPAPGSKLFIADGGNHAIASIINAAPTVNSTFNVDRAIQGSSTGLGSIGGTPSISSIPSIALDAAADRLFASTQNNVFVFDNASTASGNVPFSRSFNATVITDGVTLRGVNFYAISIDTANNRLYSADTTAEVHVFNNASTLNGPGSKTPDRTVTPNAGSIIGTFGVAVDTTKDKLYVARSPTGPQPSSWSSTVRRQRTPTRCPTTAALPTGR